MIGTDQLGRLCCELSFGFEVSTMFAMQQTAPNTNAEWESNAFTFLVNARLLKGSNTSI